MESDYESNSRSSSSSFFNTSDKEDLESIIESGRLYQQIEGNNNTSMKYNLRQRKPRRETIVILDDSSDSQSNNSKLLNKYFNISSILNVESINNVLVAKLIDINHNEFYVNVSELRLQRPGLLLDYFIQSYLRSIETKDNSINID